MVIALQGEKSEALPAPALRPLNLNDFVRSKAKVNYAIPLPAE